MSAPKVPKTPEALDAIADTVLAYHPKTKKRKPETRPASLREAWPDPTPEMLADPCFNAIWNVIKTWDINVPDIYAGCCGATGNHARVIYNAIKPWLDALKGEAESERDARFKYEDALRRKDEAMDILFERLRAAGGDFSDLIS